VFASLPDPPLGLTRTLMLGPGPELVEGSPIASLDT
jgi:hypothetical protein